MKEFKEILAYKKFFNWLKKSKEVSEHFKQASIDLPPTLKKVLKVSRLVK